MFNFCYYIEHQEQRNGGHTCEKYSWWTSEDVWRAEVRIFFLRLFSVNSDIWWQLNSPGAGWAHAPILTLVYKKNILMTKRYSQALRKSFHGNGIVQFSWKKTAMHTE